MPAHTVKILLLLGKKIVKTDNNALTNQPEIAAIPPPLSSRVVGCSGVVAEAVFVEDRLGWSGRIVDIRVRPRRRWKSKIGCNGESDDTSG